MTIAFRDVETLESRRLLSLAPLAPEVIIPQSDPSSATDVAVAANGLSLVAGIAPDPFGTRGALRVWRYSADGSKIGEPLTLDTGVASVSASMDADGDAVVAYTKAEKAYVVRISKSGTASEPKLISVPIEADAVRTAAVSMDAAGGFFVGQIVGSRIEVQAFDAAGVARAAPIVLRSFSIGAGIQIDIAARPDGTGAAAAYNFYDGNSHWNMRAAVVSVTKLESGRNVNTSQEASWPSVGINPDGSYVVGYKQFTSDAGGQTTSRAGFVRRFDAASAALGDPIHLGTGAVAVDDYLGGGFVAVFSDDGVQYAQRFDSSGSAIDAAPSSVTVADFAFPSVATDASGIATLAYVNGIDRDNQGPQGPTGPLRVVRLAGESITLNGGVLTVLGTGADDVITVKREGDNIIASLAATTESFPASQVNVLALHGLGGSDTITNDTALKATLHGGDGRDTLFGGAGEDRLHGGVGNDSLWGRDGADKLFGEDGVDSLYGNGGNDRIEGGAQSDHVRGNGGRDKLFGNGGNDRLYGGASGDWLYGQAGMDQLIGEGGNDRLYGDDGFGDTLRGGGGDDVLISLDAVRDELFGDGGRDSAAARDDNDVLTSIEVTS